MKTRIIIFLLFTLPNVSSCSFPRPVLQLYTTAPKAIMWYGREKLLFTSSGLDMELTFWKSRDYSMVFLVRFLNETGDTLLIDPAGFTLIPMDGSGNPFQEQPLPAIDPELEYLRQEVAMAQVRSDNLNNSVIRLIHATADLVETTAHGAEDDSHLSDSDVEEEFQEMNQLAQLERTSDYWANQALRKTHLPPGYEMSGIVEFRRFDQAPRIYVQYELGEYSFRAGYEQKMIGPADVR